ncbi:hypothetical protein ACKWTF_007027 [Chironomus riparius]
MSNSWKNEEEGKTRRQRRNNSDGDSDIAQKDFKNELDPKGHRHALEQNSVCKDEDRNKKLREEERCRRERRPRDSKNPSSKGESSTDSKQR